MAGAGADWAGAGGARGAGRGRHGRNFAPWATSIIPESYHKLAYVLDCAAVSEYKFRTYLDLNPLEPANKRIMAECKGLAQT